MCAIIIPFSSRMNSEKNFTKERAFVASLKKQQICAIEKLYKMYAGSLFGIITRMVKNDDISEDILQDTFVKIWRNIGQYDETKGRLFTWLVNVAKNTTIDYLRSKSANNAKTTSDISELHTAALDHVCSSSNIETIGVKKLLGALKTDQQLILDLFYFQGFTQVQVAEDLQIPLGTVKTKIRQAILTLRGMFNETAVIVKRA